MPIAFYDSSILLTILLAEPNAAQAMEYWKAGTEKLASLLLEAECRIGLKRFCHRVGSRVPYGWLEQRDFELDKSLGCLTMKNVDVDIVSILKREKALANCKTADAIHLATALFYRDRFGEDLTLFSLDKKMVGTAELLKIPIVGE